MLTSHGDGCCVECQFNVEQDQLPDDADAVTEPDSHTPLSGEEVSVVVESLVVIIMSVYY